MKFGPMVVLVAGIYTGAFCQSVWTTQYYSSTKYVTSVYFSSKNVGWSVGSGGLILKSENGGNTWVAESSGTIHNLASVQFLDTNTGWAVGDSGTILNTLNGGLTWASQNSGVSGPPNNKNFDVSLQSVHFVDKNHGWASGNYDVVLNTDNGGITWNEQISVANGPVGWPSVFFVDTNFGWVVGSDNSSGIVKRTNNGGITWSVDTIQPIPILYSTYFVSDSIGWAVGTPVNRTNPGILKSMDGGVTWNYQTGVNQSSLWHSVYFSDINHGWIVGDSGAFLTTSNGGNTWSYVNIGTTLDLQSVDFVDTSIGWVTGCSNVGCSILSSQSFSSSLKPISPLQNVLFLHLSPSFLSFTLPNNFSNPSSTATIYTVSGNKLLESPIFKSNFSMPIGNLGMGKYFLEVRSTRDKIVEPFEIDR